MLRAVAPDGHPSWFECLRAWDGWLDARGKSENTRRLYRSAMVWLAVETMVDPLDLTEDALISYLRSLPARGSKRQTIIKASRSFYGWALRRHLVPVDIAEELSSPPHRQGPAPYLTEQELARVLRAAFRKDRRRGWGLLLMYATGARESSLAAVSVDDVDFRHGVIHFRQAKGDRPYSVPLGRRGRRAASWLTADAERNGRSLLVGIQARTFWEWASEAGTDAGVKCYPHLLRHTFGTRLVEKTGMDELTWIQLMNHADGSQLKRYAGAQPERLRAAMAGF